MLVECHNWCFCMIMNYEDDDRCRLYHAEWLREANDDFHLMPIVPCCCMIWIVLAMVLHLHADGRPSDVVAASVVVYARLWCIYRPSKYSMGWGFDSVFADGPDILGRGLRQWMWKSLSRHPFAAYWGCLSALTNAIIFLDFFGDHSYEIVLSKSGYPKMQCEYYCALCNGLPTLLRWFCFVRSWCNQSFERPLPTDLMLWLGIPHMSGE